MPDSQDREYLLQLAKKAIANSYSPYSNFAVAAVVVDSEGVCHTGVNVENASYGLTICAERSAIFTAVAAGAKKIEFVLIYTSTKQPAPPCGACRQVIGEFADGTATVVSVCDSEQTLELTVSDLLPHAFEFESNPEGSD